MINVSTVMKQVADWLQDDPALDGVVIERSEFVNEDPGRAANGWLGIYRRGVNYDPRNLGVPPNDYKAELSFIVLIQRAVMSSGADSEDALEGDVKKVLDRLVQIPRTYVDHFSDIRVEYTYQNTDRTTMYFQGALVSVTAQISFEVK